jgi:hypothetical protein
MSLARKKVGEILLVVGLFSLGLALVENELAPPTCGFSCGGYAPVQDVISLLGLLLGITLVTLAAIFIFQKKTNDGPKKYY